MTVRTMKTAWAAAVVAAVLLCHAGRVTAQEVFGHWIFAGEGTTVADVSTFGHHGTLINFADTTAGAGDAQGGSGWLSTGFGLNFDGRSYEGQNGVSGQSVNDYVETTLPTAQLANQSWTFEFVGTHNTATQNWSPYIGQAGGCCIFFGKRDATNQLHANIAGIGGMDSAVIPNLTDGNPHHYALVFDDTADTLTMYFDGQNVGTLGDRTGALATDRGNMWLGGVAHNATERWDGIVYQTRVTRDTAGMPGSGALSPVDFLGAGLPVGVPVPAGESDRGGVLSFADFSSVDPAALRIYGNAQHSPATSRIRIVPSYNDSVGAVFTNGPVQMVGDYSFDTTFTFELGDGQVGDCCGDLPGADGLVFILHQDSDGATALGARGGGMGSYAGADGDIDPPSLAIEFDTWHGGSFDPGSNTNTNGNHVAINVNDGVGGTFPDASLAQTAAGEIPQLVSGQPFTARVLYDGASDQMFVFMDQGTDSPSTLLLTASLDLGQLFNGQDVYAGFTSATGGARHYTDLASWEFSSVPEPSSFAMLGVSLAGLALARRRGRKS